MVRADGIEGAVNSSFRRWLSHWEAAGLLMAGGLCAFGSGHDMGAVMGVVCAGLQFYLIARWPLIVRTGVAILGGSAFYFAIAKLFKIPECEHFVTMLKRGRVAR